jgi:hypothetical protein
VGTEYESAFAMPLDGVGWSREFERLPGEMPWADALNAVLSHPQRWFLIVRDGGVYHYVFSSQELLTVLGGLRCGTVMALEAALDLHEEGASQQVRAGETLAAAEHRPGTPRSRARFVEVDDIGQAVAVGGPDVTAPRSARGPRSEPPMAMPVPTQPPPSAEPSVSAPAGAAFEDAFGLEPSARPPEARRPRDAEDEGTTPVRHPSIESEGAVRAGERVQLLIDLQRAPSPATQGGALQLGALAPDWETMALGVTLVASGITFDPPAKGEVTIRRNQASVAARIAGTVDAALKPGDAIEVHAQFWQGRRSCGSAVRVLTVAAADQAAGASAAVAAPATAPPAAGEVAIATPQGTAGSIAVDPKAAEPDLTIYITVADPAQPGRMHWLMSLPDFDQRPPKLSGEINLGQDPRAEAAALFKEFAKLPRGQHRERIEGFGQRLWKRAPPEFHAAYWALVDHYKPSLTIQVVSDDPHLPWELMVPTRPGETHPPLALRHAVARWIGAYQGWLRNRLPAGEMVVMAPRYSTLGTKLSKAEATARQVLDNAEASRAYRARACPGTRGELLALLEHPPEPTVAMLYFTGHGLFNEAMPSASALKLEQGASLAADEIDRDAVSLGARDGTVVFFNACEVGATGGAIGEVGGWAGALAARRFRAFIAPLWAIDEEDASVATLQLIERMLVRREPIGEALRSLRAQHGATSPTFYSYILYGDVTARFSV